MVSRIGAWFNKKFVAKTNQPGEEDDDGPSPMDDEFAEEQKVAGGAPENFTAYSGGRTQPQPGQRESRFSDR